MNTTTSLQSWPIDLHSLVNFRSLYLARCSREQFEQLLNFHQLTHLSLPCDYVSQDFLQRFVIGKNREERFPQLRSIGRIWCNSGKYRSSSSSSFAINTMIQHVHLVMPARDSNAGFLQYLPELSLITVDYLAQENTFFSSCFIMAKLRRQHNSELSNILSNMHFSSETINQENRDRRYCKNLIPSRTVYRFLQYSTVPYRTVPLNFFSILYHYRMKFIVYRLAKYRTVRTIFLACFQTGYDLFYFTYIITFSKNVNNKCKL